MHQLCQGVGLNDRKYPSRNGNKDAKEYKLWNAMLYRCYSPWALNRDMTYIDCYVSENFKKYSYFYEWCQEQPGFNQKGFDLDKDLIAKGNKLYSEDICVFVPHEVNSVLNDCKTARGSLPMGITLNQGFYIARISKKNKRFVVGRFKDYKEAFLCYKTAKEDYLKEIAEEYSDVLDSRVYNYLLNHKIEITD